MNGLRILQLAVVAAATTLPGACVDEHLTAPVDQQATRSTQHGQYRGASWSELGHLIPGYGGHFVDANDKVVFGGSVGLNAEELRRERYQVVIR